MAWETIDRNVPAYDAEAPAVLTEALQEKIRAFFPRYDTKRAALLPALHIVQNTLGQVSWQAMREVADLLEIKPSDVFDVLSFYTHFWTNPQGQKVVTVCRSITCELLGGREVLEAVKKELGIDEHHTTPDGTFSIAVEECLAGCDHAPCLLINEKLHKCVKPEDVPKLLADADNTTLDMPRSTLYDGPGGVGSGGVGSGGVGSGGVGSGGGDSDGGDSDGGGSDDAGDAIGKTSDVAEMEESK